MATRTGVMLSRPVPLSNTGAVTARAISAEPFEEWNERQSLATVQITQNGTNPGLRTNRAVQVARWRPSLGLSAGGKVSRLRNDFKGALGRWGAYDAVQPAPGARPVVIPGHLGPHSAIRLNEGLSLESVLD